MIVARATCAFLGLGEGARPSLASLAAEIGAPAQTIERVAQALAAGGALAVTDGDGDRLPARQGHRRPSRQRPAHPAPPPHAPAAARSFPRAGDKPGRRGHPLRPRAAPSATPATTSPPGSSRPGSRARGAGAGSGSGSGSAGAG